MSLFCDAATGLAASFLSRRGKPSSSLERALRLVMMMRNEGVLTSCRASDCGVERKSKEREGWMEGKDVFEGSNHVSIRDICILSTRSILRNKNGLPSIPIR